MDNINRYICHVVVEQFFYAFPRVVLVSKIALAICSSVFCFLVPLTIICEFELEGSINFVQAHITLFL